MASRDFSYGADAGAWEFGESMTTGFEGRKSKWNGTMCYRVPFVSIFGVRDEESRTEITHFSTGVIAAVASLST
jgi:hypothetical protein